jgi:tetratricopeptide (TPR) repeat protein
MDETGVDKMVQGAPLNTDDRPLVSFPTTLPQEKDNLENLSRIMQFRTTPRFSTFPREEGTQVRDMLAGLPERFAGEVLYYSGEPVKALGAFHRALNANPRDRRSYELLSKIELDRAKDRVLRAGARIAKELQSEGLFAKGYVAYAKENYTEAESLFVESIAQSPAFPEPYCYLGLTLMKLGEKEKAEENLKKALEMQSQMGLAKRGLLELSGQL